MKPSKYTKGSFDPMKAILGVILLTIGVVIAVTVMTSQAPAISIATQTGTGTALANANVTSTSVAGLIYGNVNTFWALAILGIVAGAVVAAYKKGFL